MTEGGEDKRQHPRQDVSFPLIVRDGDRVIGTIEDISAGGMRVRLDGEVGENTDVKDWTGRKGAENREFVLQNAVGEVFHFSIHFMSIRLGDLKARLIRVIRRNRRLFFAMQFVEADAALLEKILGLVERRPAKK